MAFEFRHIFLTYCLERQPDGRYLALNRRYQPFGLDGPSRIEGEELPKGFKFKRSLSARQIAALSFDGDASPERIYLYNDGCIPTDSPAHWAAYSARLERLAGYKVVM